MNFGKISINNDKKALNPRELEYGSAAPIKELIGMSAGLAFMPFGGIGQLAYDPSPADGSVFVRKFSQHWDDALKKYGSKKLPWGEEVVEVPTRKVNFDTQKLRMSEDELNNYYRGLSIAELLKQSRNTPRNVKEYMKETGAPIKAVRAEIAEDLAKNAEYPEFKMKDIVDPNKHPEFYYDNPAKQEFIVNQRYMPMNGMAGFVDTEVPNVINIDAGAKSRLSKKDFDDFAKQTLLHEPTHSVDILDTEIAKLIHEAKTGDVLPDGVVSKDFKVLDSNNKPMMMMRKNPIANMLLTYKSSPQEWLARQAQFRHYLSDEQLKNTPLSFGNIGESIVKPLAKKLTGRKLTTDDLEINTVGTYPRPMRFESFGDYAKDRITQGKHKEAGDIIKKNADNFVKYLYGDKIK